MEKIFITGGFGYIGSYLAHEALKRGHDVVLYDSLIYEQNREKVLAKILENQKPGTAANVIIGDTRNKKLLEDSFLIFKPSLAVHFGELVGPYACEHNPALTHDVNFNGSRNVVDLCVKYQIPLFYNSSSSIYGNQKGTGLVNESAKLPDEPADNYCRFKIMMEQYIERKTVENPKFRAVIFRPATVGGTAPRIRLELLPNQFTYCAFAKGVIKLSEAGSYRSVINVKDLVDGYFKVIEKGSADRLVYNMGAHNFSKLDYAKRIQEIIPCEITLTPGIADFRNLMIDCTAFQNEFSMAPSVSYEETIREVLGWLREELNEIEANKFAGIINLTLDKWLKMI